MPRAPPVTIATLPAMPGRFIWRLLACWSRLVLSFARPAIRRTFVRRRQPTRHAGSPSGFRLPLAIECTLTYILGWRGRGMFDLTGRTVVIVGASRNIGAAMARAFAAAGADLFLVARGLD